MNRTIKWRYLACLAVLTVFLTGTQARAIPVLDVDLSAGYRVDQLQWNISGNIFGTNPNVLSELTWDDLKVFQLQHQGGLNFPSEKYANMETELSWQIGYGQIGSGHNQDSDYAGDNRTLEWSRSNNRANDGSVLDFSAALGLRFHGRDTSSYFMPRVGLALNEQHLVMTDGRQTLSDQSIFDAWTGQSPTDVDYITLLPLGPFPGLDSRYETRWVGPWVGFEIGKMMSDGFSLNVGFEYHWADFEANANWNLRSDFEHPVSFRHEGDGTGKVYKLGADYRLNEKWSFTMNGKYQEWSVSSGVDRVFQFNGSRPVTLLREVTWESYELMAGLRYRY